MNKILSLTCFIFATLGAAFAGWVDFNNDEPQAAVLVILVVSVLLGMLLPKIAWLWAIIIGMGVPVMYLILHLLGHRPVSPPSPAWYASLIALIPAFIGAYTGAIAQFIMKRMLVKS